MSILKRMFDVGEVVQFSFEDTDYDETTDTHTDPTIGIIDGHAVAIQGDAIQYRRLDLVKQDPVTLLFVPDTLGDEPVAESEILWDGAVRRVRFVHRLAVGAKVILT